MGKIKTLEEITEFAKAFRLGTRGDFSIIVQAHGVFDLLHPGHMRHLQAAKRTAGDGVLIVSVTSDRFVNKGPGRPVFPEAIRAEMLAALACVDFVVINDAPSGLPVIEAIKPDVFFKGSDYREHDATGKIVIETEAVEAFGGRVEFTDDLVFSSSNLINKHLNIYGPELGRYLESMRTDGSLERLLGTIDRLKNLKVCLIGETIIDEYIYTTPLGKAGKESLVATKFESKDVFYGGVLATAQHVAEFCKEVEVVTALGNDVYGVEVKEHLKANVKLHAIVNTDYQTIRKSRIIDSYSGRKIAETYFINDTPLSGKQAEQFHGMIADVLGIAGTPRHDLLMVNDFGHGLIDDWLTLQFHLRSKFLAVNAQTNAGNHGYNLVTRYDPASLACIDEAEARLATRSKHGDLESVMQSLTNFETVLVTKGKLGSVGAKRGKMEDAVPALTNSVVDTMGAGDAFFAVAAPLVALGVPLKDVCFLGNAAGALKANILGHKGRVERNALVKFVTALLK